MRGQHSSLQGGNAWCSAFITCNKARTRGMMQDGAAMRRILGRRVPRAKQRVTCNKGLWACGLPRDADACSQKLTCYQKQRTGGVRQPSPSLQWWHWGCLRMPAAQSACCS